MTTAYYGAYLIRFEGVVSSDQMHAFQTTIFWIVPIYVATFSIFKLYRGMWRYTSINDSINLMKAVFTGTIATVILILLLHRFDGFSRSVFILNGLLTLLFAGGFRLCIRFLLQPQSRINILFLPNKSKGKNLLVVGAGSAGEKLIRELRENRDLDYKLVGLLDDDPSKQKRTLHGVPVLGPIEKLPQLVEAYGVNEIAIAIPSASLKQMHRIIDICKKTTAIYKTLPGIGDIIQGKVAFSELRPVHYEDLLQRRPITLDDDLICRYLTNRRVMVTGGAGSIGSELCRQIAAFSPKQLIVLERNESGLYNLVLDLKADFPELEVIAALAAVQNRESMTHIFTRYKPEVVFHAAAYKHVPMMEAHPWEAVFNNVVGSWVLLEHCHRFGVRRCVVVSTD
jgi:FlaA1/EpsC-like NDP-sugar epimerase